MAAAFYEQFLESLKAAYQEWENAWQQRHVEADQQVVYHYTNAAGCLGIVKHQQLWASNAAFLNDSTEVVYIRDVLAEVAEELRAKYEVMADMLAYNADAMAGTGRWSARERRTASIIGILESGPGLATAILDVYVSCFCSNGDLLSQWRGYPSSGGGYALGLRSESLRRGGGLLRRVIYDKDTQRQLLRDLLVPIVDRVASADYPADDAWGDSWDWLVREHLGVVTASLAECSFCFKHPGFEAESEWRLVILHARDVKRRPEDPPPEVRAIRTGLLPYLTRSLESDAVAKVVVGPSPQPTLAADAAVQLLSNAGYENARDMVSHSAIPLRV
jgi:hypothetical protein